jgi:hypothetical protein
MTPRQAWSDELDRIILDGRSLEELSDEIGRTCGAISTRQSVIRRARDETVREDVRRSWTKDRPGAIAARNRVTENVVHYIAGQLALGPAGFNDRGAGVAASRSAVDSKPLKPQGYTAEQIAWATANATAATDDEARLMLVMHTGKRWVPPKVSA